MFLTEPKTMFLTENGQEHTSDSCFFFLTNDFPSLISLTSCTKMILIPNVKEASPQDHSQSSADLFFQVPP